MRNLILSLGLFLAVLAAPPAVRADKLQDWVPAEIDLPSDMEVIVDRAIGSSTRIFSFSTAEDAAALVAAWTEALREAGYVVDTPADALDVVQVEFSGYGIGNAKIAVTPSADDGRDVVQFDASLTQ